MTIRLIFVEPGTEPQYLRCGWESAGYIHGHLVGLQRNTRDEKVVSLAKIIAEVAVKHQVSAIHIASRIRIYPVVRARHEFFYRAMNETGCSGPRIAAYCGGLDSSTVFSGAGKHAIRYGVPFPRGATWTSKKLERVAA